MNVIGWVMFFVVSLFLSFYIQGLMVKRAIFQVLQIFRREHSLCSQRPKKLEELGLQPPGLMERMFRLRDYKPYALQALVKAKAVRLGDDGRLCLREENVPDVFRRNRSMG